MNHAPHDDAWDDMTQPSSLVSGQPHGARVLVVDDDPSMRALVATHLSSAGYDVHEASSGLGLLQAVEAIALDRFPLDGVDLIVLDQRMPGIFGLDAIRRLRAAHWETPAILMTAFPDAELKREAAALHVLVLPKPFSLALLSSAVLLSLLSKPERGETHGFRVAC